MNLKTLPRLKDTKLKIKKTFAISQDCADVYLKAKEVGVDVTKICTDSIEKSLYEIKKLISTQST